MSSVEFTNTSFVHYFTFRKVRSKAPAYSPSKSGYNAKQYEPIPRKRTKLISESLTTQASLFFSVNLCTYYLDETSTLSTTPTVSLND